MAARDRQLQWIVIDILFFYNDLKDRWTPGNLRKTSTSRSRKGARWICKFRFGRLESGI